jgi:hypothetical protein
VSFHPLENAEKLRESYGLFFMMNLLFLRYYDLKKKKKKKGQTVISVDSVFYQILDKNIDGGTIFVLRQIKKTSYDKKK